MSARHRNGNVPASSKEELRSHAKGERHRIHADLNAISRVTPETAEDVEEPVESWVPPHHHDLRTAQRRSPRPWKQRFWKRRSAARRLRSALEHDPQD